ncbi:hypothetical protein H4R33_004909, partial [Dimargaris cristalligena]
MRLLNGIFPALTIGSTLLLYGLGQSTEDSPTTKPIPLEILDQILSYSSKDTNTRLLNDPLLSHSAAKYLPHPSAKTILPNWEFELHETTTIFTQQKEWDRLLIIWRQLAPLELWDTVLHSVTSLCSLQSATANPSRTRGSVAAECTGERYKRFLTINKYRPLVSRGQRAMIDMTSLTVPDWEVAFPLASFANGETMDTLFRLLHLTFEAPFYEGKPVQFNDSTELNLTDLTPFIRVSTTMTALLNRVATTTLWKLYHQGKWDHIKHYLDRAIVMVTQGLDDHAHNSEVYRWIETLQQQARCIITFAAIGLNGPWVDGVMVRMDQLDQLISGRNVGLAFRATLSNYLGELSTRGFTKLAKWLEQKWPNLPDEINPFATITPVSPIFDKRYFYLNPIDGHLYQAIPSGFLSPLPESLRYLDPNQPYVMGDFQYKLKNDLQTLNLQQYVHTNSVPVHHM